MSYKMILFEASGLRGRLAVEPFVFADKVVDAENRFTDSLCIRRSLE